MSDARNKQFTPEEQVIIDAIMDLFDQYNVDPLNGERMLLWSAGASIGLRQGALTSEHVLDNLTDGWQAALQYR